MSVDAEIQELLEAAFGAEIGIAVKSSDVDKLRRTVYIFRRKSQNPDFARLSLTVPRARRDELWIVHTQRLDFVRQGESSE